MLRLSGASDCGANANAGNTLVIDLVAIGSDEFSVYPAELAWFVDVEMLARRGYYQLLIVPLGVMLTNGEI